MPIWGLIALAAILNVGTVFCIKASNGMTHPWYALGVILTIVPVQFLVAHVIAQGGQAAQALIVVIVSVLIGAALIDHFTGRPASGLQWTGYGIAFAGVALATFAPRPA